MTKTSTTPTPTPTPTATARSIVYAAAADVVLVFIFAASGRASHAEGDSLSGVLLTAWPFLAGLALGWLASRIWRRPLRLWPNAVAVWLVTVVAGMVFRLLSGKTAEFSFVVVATVVLGIFLLGHRALASVVLRRRFRGRIG